MEVFTLIARKKKCGAGICFVPACSSCCDKSSDYLHRICTGYFICSSIWTYCISYDNGTEHRV